jgi:hypothetical protein
MKVGQMFMTKSDLGAHLSSLRTGKKNKLTNKFDRIDARLLPNCMRNSLKFLDLFFMKFSASISGTKKFAQGGWLGTSENHSEPSLDYMLDAQKLPIQTTLEALLASGSSMRARIVVQEHHAS